jgi:hypothetical protein
VDHRAAVLLVLQVVCSHLPQLVMVAVPFEFLLGSPDLSA